MVPTLPRGVLPLSAEMLVGGFPLVRKKLFEDVLQVGDDLICCSRVVRWGFALSVVLDVFFFPSGCSWFVACCDPAPVVLFAFELLERFGKGWATPSFFVK